MGPSGQNNWVVVDTDRVVVFAACERKAVRVELFQICHSSFVTVLLFAAEELVCLAVLQFLLAIFGSLSSLNLRRRRRFPRWTENNVFYWLWGRLFWLLRLLSFLC